jgi:succinoglycan biosynthesis transport protein ExoP
MQATGSQDFDFKRYWALLRRKRYLAISTALAVLSIFTWGSLLWPKTYEAESTVFVERNFLFQPAAKGSGVSASIEERLRTLQEALKSRNLVDRTMKKLDLDTRAKNSAQYEARIDEVIKNIDVKIKGLKDRPTADLFEISYRDREPKTVRDFVNTLVSEYIEENVGYSRTQADESYEFMQGQLLDYKKKLEESDKAIREFRERNPRIISETDSSLAIRLDKLAMAKVDVDMKLKELLTKRDDLQKQLSGQKEIVAGKEGPQAKLRELNNRLMELSAKYTDDYPEVKKVKGEIEEMKKQMARAGDPRPGASGTGAIDTSPVRQQLKEQLNETDTEIATLKAQNAELMRQQKAAQGTLGLIPREQEMWAKLERDRSVNQKIYDDLMQRLESAGFSKDLELTNKAGTFRIVDPAILPYIPVKPNTVLMIVLGILLGIASGIAVVIWADHISHSFKDEGSIESRFKLPVLATINTVTTQEDKIREKKLDKKVFIAAGVYFLFIFLLLAEEFLYRYMNIRIFNL